MAIPKSEAIILSGIFFPFLFSSALELMSLLSSFCVFSCILSSMKYFSFLILLLFSSVMYEHTTMYLLLKIVFHILVGGKGVAVNHLGTAEGETLFVPLTLLAISEFAHTF